MSRPEITTYLTNQLSSEFIVADEPDHPELLSGPDVLVGGRGLLTALFRISKHTKRRILEARIVATRLALPSATRVVALIEPDASLPPWLIDNGFDFVLEAHEQRQMARLCEEPWQHNKVADLIGVQRRHALIYSTLLEISELRRQHELQPQDGEAVLRELNVRFPTPGETFTDETTQKVIRGKKRLSELRSISIFQTKVALLPKQKKQSPAERFLPFWTDGLLEDFEFDTGIPYRRKALPRVVMVESWPSRRGDPDKPMRAAAFSGWVMAVSTTASDMEELVERSISFMQERLNEYS